jgi:hypothetical protein
MGVFLGVSAIRATPGMIWVDVPADSALAGEPLEPQQIPAPPLTIDRYHPNLGFSPAKNILNDLISSVLQKSSPFTLVRNRMSYGTCNS